MPYQQAFAPVAQSFHQWHQGLDLPAVLARAQDDVREHPTLVHARWLLFELLCLMGTWERALKQLQTCATLNPALEGTAQAMRGLIRAERQREEVFTGRLVPTPVTGFPSWVDPLTKALIHNVAQQHEHADTLREMALAAAPGSPGEGNLGVFQWISDSDTRLGPVCEVVTGGSYRWLPFADIRSITLSAPERLLDLVWSSAQLVLRDGTQMAAYVPVRYPHTPSTTDAQRLALETVWQDVGTTGVFAQGQKTWMTDTGDWALLDIRHCEFHVNAT